jgi:hypothetical protein
MCMLVISPFSARLVGRFGTKFVVTSGLLCAAAGLLALSQLQVESHYWPDVMWRMGLMATGMSLTMAPATESIMSSLPLGKAGVGSAVNDTTRQVGGALGVAVIGSVLSSVYGSKVGSFLVGKPVPRGVAVEIKQSLGFALRAGHQLPGLAATAQRAFVDGLHSGILVGAGAALVGAVIAMMWLPARAREEDVSAQEAERSPELAAPRAMPASTSVEANR